MGERHIRARHENSAPQDSHSYCRLVKELRLSPDRLRPVTLWEPPYADPHVRWCGGRGRKTPGYPIIQGFTPGPWDFFEDVENPTALGNSIIITAPDPGDPQPWYVAEVYKEVGSGWPVADRPWWPVLQISSRRGAWRKK